MVHGVDANLLKLMSHLGVTPVQRSRMGLMFLGSLDSVRYCWPVVQALTDLTAFVTVTITTVIGTRTACSSRYSLMPANEVTRTL